MRAAWVRVAVARGQHGAQTHFVQLVAVAYQTRVNGGSYP